MISEKELYILSYYRACELAGAILFGKLAFHTEVDEIRIPLTEHSLEESEHAWLWTKVIQDFGAVPLKITNAYQTEYAKEFGMPKNILEILCLTQVFEKRTLFHFKKHLKMKGTHPRVKKVLQKMIDDESGHIGWIKKKLIAFEKKEGKETVKKTLQKLEAIDEKVYKNLLLTEAFSQFA